MKKVRTFKVVFEPDEDGWHAYIPAVKGCRTWGKTLGYARRNVREALSTCVDVLGENADVIAKNADLQEDVRLPSSVLRALRRAKVLGEKLAREADNANEARIAAIAALTAFRVGIRDVGNIVDLSHQRIAQLTAKKEQAKEQRGRARNEAKPLPKGSTAEAFLGSKRSTERTHSKSAGGREARKPGRTDRSAEPS
jgi:predicted RNase H-like HicB family nuclease